MQEDCVYDALFDDMQDDELTAVLGRQMRRRGCVGAAVLRSDKTGETNASFVWYDDWNEVFHLPLQQQLLHLAALVGLGQEVERKEMRGRS